MYLKAQIFLYCFSLSFIVHAQDTEMLVLEKLGTKKRTVYRVGEDIILKLKGDSKEFRGTILEFYDSTFVVEDVYVDLSDIQYVKTVHTEGFFSPSNGPKLIVAGVALLLIDQLNHTVIQGNDFRIPQEIAIASGALIVAGVFWTSLKYRKFKPGNNRRIRIFRM